MKRKPKLNLVLQLATICLCVCAIAIGVYSVKNASLSVTGTVAFTAHDCKVDVTAYIYGDAVDSSNNASSTGTPRTEANKGTLGTWSGVTDKTGSQTIDSSKNFYFSDMGESGEVEDITIVFTITNQSDFPVKAVIDNATSSTSSITFTDAGDFARPVPGATIVGTMPAKSNTCNLAIKLKLSDSTKSSNAYSISLSFEKYTPATSLTGLTNGTVKQVTGYDEDYGELKIQDVSRTYLTMGKSSESEANDNMKWYIFAQSNSKTGAMESVTSQVTLTNGNLPSGTYWFISEYALDGQPFNDSESSNVYNDSEIKTYLSGSYLTKHSLSNNDIYNQISERTLVDDTTDDGNVDSFVTTENQKLWLLSKTELSYLINSNVEVFSSYLNLIGLNESLTGILWWTRSPYSGIDDVVVIESPTGQVTNISPGNGAEYGVRPAFQITI